ncbi:MAG: hypothetical protein BHW60_02260 [Sutterella sp. 54_7]|nr:MAG: hypothetical protein BHW60_02260 [Sutterella sp. 54_7]
MPANSGFLLSASAALGLALLLYRRPLWESALSLVLEALRVIPPLSLVPLLILWLGIDEAPKLAIVVLASFFPIYLSALTALRSVSSKYKELAQMLGLTESARVQEILLPGAAPGILTGLRLGFGYAWRALVGAELIAAASGLGYLIEDASSLARTDVVMVGILTIAGLGILCDQLFRRGAEGWTKSRLNRRRKSSGGQTALETLWGIAFEGLVVSYPGLTQPPVNHLTLSIVPGSVTAVLGRSGCGKTTLLKAAAGLLLPQAGAGRFTSPNASGRTHPKVAMEFQEPLLLPWKTVRENAALALSARTGEALAEACKSAAVTQALTLAGIADLAERFPAELSGGQQQRAGLARALSAEPDVLLMDEPFGALDALTRLELQDETRALFNRRRMTVLMITHDVREAVRMADRAVVLRGGSAAADHSLLMPFPRRFSDPAVGAAEEGLLAELLHH